VAGSRSSWTEEKCHLQSRVDELDVQLASALKKLSNATAAYKQVFNDNVPIVLVPAVHFIIETHFFLLSVV